MNKRVNQFASACLSVGLMCTGAWAHHSVAAYDQSKVVALAGTVKEFKYTNPHSWITVSVPDGKGGESEWSLEGMSVNMLVRKGWTRDTIRPGMKIKVRIAPRKDGQPGGEWTSVLELDGKPFLVSP